jgi:two-component system sensor histidine kinase QseC
MKTRSLLRNLLAWALAALVLVWAFFIVVGFRTGVHEADELTDGHLASVASLLLSEHEGRFDEKRDVGATVSPDLKRHDYQQSMSVVVWDGAGRVLTRTGEAPVPPFDPSEGFADLQLGDPPQTWRTFSQWDGPRHARKVTVLLSVKERDDLAWDIAEQMAEPGLWLLPVIAIALGLAIQRGLTPLHALSRDVHALDVTQAVPLQARHPHTEFKAVVDAINLLIERQQATLTRERQLASELAHELRTPLASLTLHARALRGTQSDAERADSLERLERDSLRAGHVLAQLLALARASRTEMAETAQALDLNELAHRVVADYAQPALDSGHELALSATGSFPLSGHPVLLELALRNLIDNAIGHTPPGTLVEVQLDPHGRWLQVCDDGVQTPAARAVSVATPAADAPAVPLTLGLGLGHRVIAKVAAIHNAEFAKVDAPAGFSTCYRLSFAPP